MRKLNKLLPGSSALLIAAQIASAEISINWNSPAATFYKADGTTLLPNSSLFLAYWSADNVIGFNPADPLNPSVDTYLGHRNTHPMGGTSKGRITGYSAGDMFSESSYGKGPDEFVSGYVYLVVVDMPYTATLNASDLVGKNYVVAPGNPPTPQGGPLTDATPSSGPPPLPDDINYGGLTYSTTGTLVPEPGAAMLAAVGALAAVWIRRRQRDRLSD